MGFDVTVRAARRSDFGGIERVARAAWRAAYEGVLDAATREGMIAEGYDESVLERLADLDEVGFFVAVADDGVVGYASCGATDPAGIGDFDLYVHPDYWGEGIGTRLLSRGPSSGVTDIEAAEPSRRSRFPSSCRPRRHVHTTVSGKSHPRPGPRACSRVERGRHRPPERERSERSAGP